MRWSRCIAACGRILCPVALALPVIILPARAVTQQSSFQVSAFVLASCALPAWTATPQDKAQPQFIACGHAPAMSPILASPPRAILYRDQTGDGVLTMEF